MIIHYITEENIFVVIVYKLLVQKKIFKSHTNECFRIIDKQTIKIAGKGELLDSKIIKGKKITIYDLCRF